MFTLSSTTGLPMSKLERVLAVPELLDTILSFLSDGDCARIALVCKQWSEAALNVLWRRVDDVSRLFELLVPLTDTGTSDEPSYAFSRTPEPADWTRFSKYAHRVRHLTHDPSLSRRPLAPRAWDDLARTRPALTILPALHTLEWLAPVDATHTEAALAHSIPFMHARVRTFVLRIPSIASPGANENHATVVGLTSYVQHVLARMQNLRTLDIRMDASFRAVAGPILRLLCGLEQLRTVTLPPFWMTTVVVEALAGLPNLRTVGFELFFEHSGQGSKADVASFNPRLSKGAFPKLKDLALSASLTDVRKFVQHKHGPRGLTHLFVHTPLALEDATNIENLLSSLPSGLPNLQYLVLELRDDELPPSSTPPSSPSTPSSPPPDPPSISAVLASCTAPTLSTLLPLHSLPHLRTFELYHPRALALSPDELTTLACGLPQIHKLVLNPEPMFPARARVSIASLESFAEFCPHLQELGIFLNARTLPSPLTVSSTPPPESPHFANLHTLNMGVSPLELEGVGETALWLSKLVTPQCTVASGYTWQAAAKAWACDGAEEVVVRRCKAWDEVAAVVPLMARLRCEERERRRKLEREVEDLKTRNSVLMGMAGLRSGPAKSARRASLGKRALSEVFDYV